MWQLTLYCHLKLPVWLHIFDFIFTCFYQAIYILCLSHFALAKKLNAEFTEDRSYFQLFMDQSL